MAANRATSAPTTMWVHAAVARALKPSTYGETAMQEPGNKIDPLLGAGTPAGSCRRRGRCPQFSTFQSVFFNPLAATSTHGEVAVMFRSGDHLVAACVECGSRAVVIGGELTSGAFVRCGECESPRGTYAEFFEEIRARGMYADFRQEIRAALSESSGASCNDNHRAKQS
jgi:hypothetical protein